MSRLSSILKIDQLLELPHWEVVVAGFRNSRRVLETTADQLPERHLFEEALACAEQVVRGQSSAENLEPYCDRVYQVAARLAARSRCEPGSLAEPQAATQAIHMAIDSVADFDLDSYEAVCAAYLSLKAASRLAPRGLIHQVGLDLELVVALSEQYLPAQILDAFGPLWRATGSSEDSQR